MYLLARKQSLALPGSVLASIALGSVGFLRIARLWRTQRVSAVFICRPGCCFAWRAAALDLRYAVAVAALLVLTLLEGGVYRSRTSCCCWRFDAGVRLALREHVRGILVAGVVAAPLTAVARCDSRAAILDELRRNPRTMVSRDGVSLPRSHRDADHARHEWHYGTHQFVWPEYVTYVGWGHPRSRPVRRSRELLRALACDRPVAS